MIENIEEIFDFIDNATQSDIQEIYDHAKDKGGIEDDCEECEECEDCETDLEGVMRYTAYASQDEANEIYNAAAQNLKFFKIENLADQMKIEFINSIWDKYTLEQLEEKLKVKASSRTNKH